MADGIRLGGAYYELSADTAPLIAALAKAEQQSKRSAQQIAQATGIPEKAVARYAAQAIRDHQAVEAARAREAAAAKRAADQIAAANARAAGSIQQIGKAAGAMAGSFLTAAAATALLSKGLDKVVESTKAAEQSQFALAKTYGAASQGMAEFAKDFAAQTQRSRVEVQQAAVVVGNLTKEYGLNTAQAQSVIRIASDLAAVYGKDLPDAVQRLQSAIRGEAEAAESLGLVLNDEAVAVRQLGQENKTLFEKLTDSEKAQLRLAEATRQLGERQGAANERTQTALGAFDRLDAATTDLAASIGQRLLPVAAQIANVLSTMAEGALAAMNALGDLSKVDAGALANIASALFNPVGVVAAIAAGQNPFLPSATGQGGPMLGPTPGEVANAQNAESVDAIRRKAARRAELEAQAKAADDRAEAEIKAIEKERDAKETWYDEERTRIEARRTYQLEDIERRKDAAIAALEEEKQAERDRLDALIRQAEREKDVRLDLAQAAHDAAEQAIDDQERLNRAQRLSEDRAISDERQAEDRARADAIESEDRARETAHRDELRRLEERHAAFQKGIDAEEERVKQTTERRLRAIAEQSDAARRASEKVIRSIDAQADREEDRHRAAMRALDDELDVRKKALDVQLDALAAAEKAEGNARRTADLQKRIIEAQQGVVAARGTGTADEIAAARGDLTRALRVGNEVSIANARERLAKLAGQGNEAIKKADEELAAAQQELRDEGVSQARDAERAKLEAAKQAVDDDIDVRRRAEDDRNRERKRELDADKQAEQDRLKARLDTLEKKAQATRDAADRDLTDIRARATAEKEAYEQTVRDAKSAYDEQTRLIDQRREVEERAIDDRRESEDRARADRRTAEDEALRLQKAAIDAALAQERKDTEAHYNGPNGVITQLRQAVTDSEREYSRRLAAARASFEAERKQAELIYRNPEKTGLLDLLESARVAELKSLDESKKNWQEWSKAVQESVKAAMDGLTRTPGDAPAAGRAPSGQNTSTSTASTTSGRSGQKVKGDVVSWLNDAMDITGVGNNWLAGLQRLVQLESGGDPHNVNPEDVIDRNGVNLGNAKGLLQMLTPTFRANRDKSLPDDIFDPVANAVAAIRYIERTYGHVNHIPGLFEGKFKGYDSGHLFTEPTLTYGLRSGARAMIAERRPELLLGGAATQDRASLVGAMPTRDYAAVGSSLAALTGSGPAGGADVVNFYGVTYEQAAAEQRRRQHRQSLLRGAATLGRRR